MSANQKTLPQLDVLVTAAACGDAQAFGAIVDATSGMVSSITLAILRDLDLSRDVAQEVFLAAWKDLARLRNPASFLPWLRQTARNRANDALRTKIRQRRTVFSGDEDDLLATVADPRADTAGTLLAEEELRILSRAIDDLPDETREVVVLFYREEQSVRQVSLLLGLSEDAVRQRLSRARVRLREAILDRAGEALRRTAPGAAFSAAILTALAAAAPAAATTTAGGLGVSATAKWGGFGKVLASIGGAVASGVAGVSAVLLGVRLAQANARDERERADLHRFAAVGCVLVISMATGLAFAPSRPLWIPLVIFGAFIAGLGLLQFVWLPRILARRWAAERAEDEGAAARQRRERRLGFLGWLGGALVGGGGLLVGLLR
jgi:RNA polymerase sigma factor (sigma-70 family)